MIRLNHSRIFFNALRTAILFVAGFIIYELLIHMEKMWNALQPNNELMNFHKRKIIKFTAILIIDLLLLYLFALIFDIHV